MSQHRDEFLEAFEKERSSFSKKLGRGKSNRNNVRDPGLIQAFDKIAESMAGSISKRFGEYATAYDLDKVALEPQADHATLVLHHVPAEGPSSDPALAHLEAELERRYVEEARLRSELMERINADSGAALRECNIEFLEARQAASGHTVETAVTTKKGERLRQEVENNEALLSALASLSATLDEERVNNRRIEDQLSQPPHPVEADLRAPLGHGVLGNTAESPEVGEETQELAALLEQDRQVCEHMQQPL